MRPRTGLSFDSVSFGYDAGGPPVLRGLSVDVAPGTVTAILGPNGAGKTTLLLLALGWLVPRTGRILVGGVPLAELPPGERGRLVALVPQSERMAFDYSVLDFALLGRAPYLAPLDVPGPDDRAIAARAVERAGLGPLARRHVTTLSAGERQLALIARALGQDPGILLLDEPTSHLDLANKARILSLIRALSARGVTVLLTTHEPEAASFATDIVLMREGRVRRAGPTAEVFTAEHLSATYGIPVAVTEVGGRRVASWSPLEAASEIGGGTPVS
jgi:iron complex transport system ATP-binding protein